MVPVSRHIFAINLHTHTEWRTESDRYFSVDNFLIMHVYRCFNVTPVDHLCLCLHLCTCFLNCIVEVASLCCGWIIHSETVKVTILLLKPLCRISIPKLFHKNNYFPVTLPGSCTVHIAHTCICGRQALQSLLKDSSTSRSSLLSWKSNTCTGKGNTMEPLN